MRRLARDGAPERAAPQEEDARLLAAVAAGDDGDALVDLYRRYETPLYRLGLRLLKDEGMAEELVQDTFVRLWRSAPRFDPGRGSVRTFTFVIAYSVASDLRRRVASRRSRATAARSNGPCAMPISSSARSSFPEDARPCSSPTQWSPR